MHNYSLAYFNLLLLFYLLLSKVYLWCVLKWVSLGLSRLGFAQLFQCVSLCLWQIWEVFSHYAFKYSFSIFQIPFFFSLGDFSDTVGCFALFHRSLRPWSFYLFTIFSLLFRVDEFCCCCSFLKVTDFPVNDVYRYCLYLPFVSFF